MNEILSSNDALNYLRAELFQGLFAVKSSDLQTSEANIQNRTIKIGKSSRSLDDLEFLKDGVEEEIPFPQLHALNWADVFLRAERASISSSVGNFAEWQRILTRWWELNENSKNSRLWASLIVLQRSLNIVRARISSPENFVLPQTLITKHYEELMKALGSYSQSNQVRMAIPAIMVLGGLSEVSRDNFETVVVESIERFVPSSGLVLSKNFDCLPEEIQGWKRLIQVIDPLGEFTQRISQNLKNREFVVHLTQPSGLLRPIGQSSVKTEFTENASPEEKYVVSNGVQGRPPRDVRFVEPAAIVTGRSGWGETENLFSDETFWSMILGPRRGRESHQDLGSITYSGQGTDWIIDIGSDPVGLSTNHSGISLNNIASRVYATATLATTHENDLSDDYIISLDSYLPVRWKRHATFVRTSNDLIIEDVLRASNDFSGHQNWIVPRDLEVSVDRDNVTLFDSVNDRRCRITTSRQSTEPIELHEIEDEVGNRIATRIAVPFSGRSVRIVTAISVVKELDKYDVRRMPVAGNEFVLDFSDKRRNERVVVTHHGSLIMSPSKLPQESVDEAIQLLATGGLTEDQAIEQRTRTHVAIKKAKASIWESQNRLVARELALRELIEFRNSEKLFSLRDHGLMPCMIDIAGSEFRELLREQPSFSNFRRTPLIDWEGVNVKHEFYQAPIVTTRSTALSDVDISGDFIWSVDLGNLVPSAFIKRSPGDTLMVYFHGATDRTRFEIPRYERMASFGRLGTGPVMFFTDPTLDLDSRSILSWYLGTEEINLHEKIAQMINSAAQYLRINRVVLVGNSGGGFASLQVATYLNGAEAISVNGQVVLANYQPRILETAMWSVFGRSLSKLEIQSASRLDVTQRLRDINFDMKFLMFQNTGDEHHYLEHFVPLRDVVESSSNSLGAMSVVEKFQGDGHVAPSTEEYEALVRDWISGMEERDHLFRGLRN